MKKMYVLVWGVFLFLHSYSQEKLVILHPAVGDTIDKIEKVKFLLLPEIKDSDFDYCIFRHSGEEFRVNLHTQNDSLVLIRMDSAEYNRYRENISKLEDYYSDSAKRDSIKSSQKITLDLKGPNSFQLKDPVVGSDDKDRILEEVRKNTRLKGDAERQKIVQDGNDLFGNSARIEFLNFKRKKKN